MSSVPSFVKWADEDIIRRAKADMFPRMEEWRNPEVDFKISWSFEDIRKLATVVSEIGYDKYLYKQLSYEERKSLDAKLNALFDSYLGDLLPVYNMLDKKLNKEKWTGDQRYRLLALHNRKGYAEMGVLKNVIWFSTLTGKEITIELAEELAQVMTNRLYWEFGYEYKGSDWDESLEQFAVANECRKKEIQVQNDFVYHVLVGDISEAYKMIEGQIEKQIKKYF